MKHTVALRLNPKCLVHDPHVQFPDGDPSKTHCVSCDRSLDSWPGSLNLTGFRPCGRWNRVDIRFTLTLAFSTSDFYMHLTLTDEASFSFLLRGAHNNESNRQSFILGANKYMSSTWQPSLLAILINMIKICHLKLAVTTMQILHTEIGCLHNPRCVFR